MLKVSEEFSKVSSAKVHSVVKMENEIEDLEAKIDATVFKLYGINTSQMNSVMASLSLPEVYQLRVNHHYTKSN